MAQAMGYLLNQWDALGVYTTQCFLSIDNNAAARALKRVVIGRKNSLFAGNDPAAQKAAKFYSLIAGAECHGIDPHQLSREYWRRSTSGRVRSSRSFCPMSGRPMRCTSRNAN
jgi:hypothetical protein